MYGGSAYSYAHDPDFTDVSSSEKFWQKVIDAFYEKYYGFRNWHSEIVQTAVRDGKLIMPTGRIYEFELERDYKGELKAPETVIKNYPVQGLGADMMSIARVSFMRRFKDAGINGILVNSVHDSIVCDVHASSVKQTAEIFHSVFNDLPSNYNRIFGAQFDLPMTCEVGVGNNMKELTEYIL